MSDHTENSADNSGNRADEMAEYLQTFLDETEEQLDDLVETMLALERDTTDSADLNEAFRLIHSIKGSAGMMGFDHITVLTHHLESRFERFRSGLAQLDEPTMNLVLRCVDFLRQCGKRLRAGEQLGSPTELLGELKRLEEQAETPAADEPPPTAPAQQGPAAVADLQPSRPPLGQDVAAALLYLVVRFRPGLPLADLKARLIVARLAALGQVESTQPELGQLADAEQFSQLELFEIWIDTPADLDDVRQAADVEGVESIEFDQPSAKAIAKVAEEVATPQEDATDEPTVIPSESSAIGPSPGSVSATSSPSGSDSAPQQAREETPTHTLLETAAEAAATVAAPPSNTEERRVSVANKPTKSVAETMRVDIDRLDNLMNLTGELVVNRARFEQISGQISPALGKASMLNRFRDFSDTLQRTIENLENSGDAHGDLSRQIQQLRAGLELMEEQTELWDNGRHCFAQIGEAIDQLSRVSHSLQRGVMDTRMVSVGPLFNRFQRVIRDLSKERGKKVNLLIRGERTELDKRMIDELGDPLMHLVRNSIDHGLESPEVRVGRGKSEVGSIFLEASHSGNNVTIYVRDDGGGIDGRKIRDKLIDKQILSAAAAEDLTDEQVIEYIWHPGFSTAQEVTDVSGRGVGMDVVKTRIIQLNGTIEVEATPERGTAFAIRLPLTLAIINCLHVRMRDVIFSLPIDDVREIVSVKDSDVVTVHGKQTFEVRGEYLPLVSIDDVFEWHDIHHGGGPPQNTGQTDSPKSTAQVVVLHASGKTLGLRVDELLGSQDIVIKSLSDNLMNIVGLSGASILGDGSVCLILDVNATIDLAFRQAQTVRTEVVTR